MRRHGSQFTNARTLLIMQIASPQIENILSIIIMMFIANINIIE